MSSTINSLNLLGSGGHRWDWSSPEVFGKKLITAGCRGADYHRTAVGSARVVISGVLKAASDAALKALRAPIVALKLSRQAVAWTDDQGNSGSRLVITDFMPERRQYGPGGVVWQRYVIIAEEADGGPDA